MEKKILESITDLVHNPFTIQNITMMRANVTPPSSFKARKGWRKMGRFFYVINGTFNANTHKGKSLVAKPGDMLYLPGDVEYESEWSTGTECEYISLECTFWETDSTELVLGEDMYLICRDKTEKYFKSMLKMYEYFSSNTTSSNMRVLSGVYGFIGDIIEDEEKRVSKNADAVSSIYKGIIYIEDNYRNDIMINEIAKLCNLSESTFRRKFYKRFGMSPYDYINNLKIQKAKELLESGMYSVKEVADFLNFYDTSHFNKFFKKHCGITPSNYISD